MNSKWVLEGYLGDSGQLTRLPLDKFPVTVGRDPNSVLALPSNEVSRHHAIIELVDGRLRLTDLGSTNGTFVNRHRLEAPVFLDHGNVIHFASYELRVIEENEWGAMDDGDATRMISMPLPSNLPTGLNELQALLREKVVRAYFQPIVDLQGRLYGYELLGRGAYDGLPESPVELFRIAESTRGNARKLSQVMRDEGVRQAYRMSPTQRLFVNTHPSELEDMDELLRGMERLVKDCPTLRLVLEVHENAVTDIDKMIRFSNTLKEWNIELAYDDFGAGQARLLELADVPINYVKFDMGLIRNLPNAPQAKRDMVADLAQMTRKLGITNLAEGVETPEELALCEQMGFDLIQGYYFGKPSKSMDYGDKTG